MPARPDDTIHQPIAPSAAPPTKMIHSRALSGATVPFSSLDDNDDIRGYLDYISDSLTDNALLPRRTGQHERVAAGQQYADEAYEEAAYDDRRRLSGGRR